MQKRPKKLASKPQYVSPKQMTLEGFETPFERHLNTDNRWVKLSHLLPWDEVCNMYLKEVGVSQTGRKLLSPRIVIGALIIKHTCNLSDEETIEQISENIYMQYFLGYSSFDPEPAFDPSLFVEIRKRLGAAEVNAINERIIALKTHMESLSKHTTPPASQAEENDKSNDKETGGKRDEISDATIYLQNKEASSESSTAPKCVLEQKDDHQDNTVENKGRVIFDATACPQDIAFPTDLNLLSDAREKSEELIDKLYNPDLHVAKPRTYREVARKEYLKTAQKKNKSGKEIRRAVKKQLGYLHRNNKSIDKLLDAYSTIALNRKDYKYMLVIRTVYEQQATMFQNHVHTIDDRIVSIHQPHVRPIVRGKAQAKVEFGPKIHISLIDGITFLDEISWNAFNEGTHMMKYVENYYKRFGFYPREILADKIYCTRNNRRELKEKGIKLIAKPLGRPAAVTYHVRPGERNPVEGKFGQAKTAYGLGRIRARLKQTSESWIASIILVLNLVKLAGTALYCLILGNTNNIYCYFEKLGGQWRIECNRKRSGCPQFFLPVSG